MCAFHPGSYTSFLIRQCLNTVPVKLKKWYFAAHWRLWWKVEYPEIKPRKKCSKKLPCDMCIHFTELKFTVHCSVWKLSLSGICEGIVIGAQRPVMSKEIPSVENRREAFWATDFWCVYSSHRFKSFFGLSSLKSLFLWNLRKDIWECSLEYAEKLIPSDKHQKVSFCKTALFRVISTHIVKLLFLLSIILILLLFSLWKDIRESFEAYGENRNIFR